MVKDAKRPRTVTPGCHRSKSCQERTGGIDAIAINEEMVVLTQPHYNGSSIHDSMHTVSTVLEDAGVHCEAVPVIKA